MIKIKPQNKGKFTDWANSHNMGVQEAASKIMANTEEYSPTLVKRANFARNAAKWNKMLGGILEKYQKGGKRLLGDLDSLTEEEMMNGPVEGFVMSPERVRASTVIGDLNGLTEEQMMNGPVNGFIGNVIPEEMPYMSSIPTYSQLLEQYSPQMQAQPIAYMPPKEAMKLILDDIKQQAAPKKKIDRPSKKKITSNNAAPANNNNSNNSNLVNIYDILSKEELSPTTRSSLYSNPVEDLYFYVAQKYLEGKKLSFDEMTILNSAPHLKSKLEKHRVVNSVVRLPINYREEWIPSTKGQVFTNHYSFKNRPYLFDEDYYPYRTNKEF